MNELLLAGLKSIGSGLATIGVTGAGIGIGLVFAAYIAAVGKKPEMEKNLFPYTILRFALAQSQIFKKTKLIVVSLLLVLIVSYFLIFLKILELQNIIHAKAEQLAREVFDRNLVVVNKYSYNWDVFHRNSTTIIIVTVGVLLGATALYYTWPAISCVIWPVATLATDVNMIEPQPIITSAISGQTMARGTSESISATQSASADTSNISMENPFIDPDSPRTVNRFLGTNSIPFENVDTMSTSIVRTIVEDANKDEVDEVFRQHLVKILGNYLKPGAIDKYEHCSIEKLLTMIKKVKEVLLKKGEN